MRSYGIVKEQPHPTPLFLVFQLLYKYLYHNFGPKWFGHLTQGQ